MRREWTDREEKYLENQYSQKSVKEVAEYLKRSISSVKHKAARLNLNNYEDCLSAKELARCFNCDVSVTLRWIRKLGLLATEIKNSTFSRYEIDHKKFWKWAENHKNDINWKKYQLGSLPLESEWVIGEKHKMINSRNRERYTEYEIAQVKCLMRRGINLPRNFRINWKDLLQREIYR